MKRVLLFLFIALTLVGFSQVAFADTITLPNPLCPGGAGSTGCVSDFPTLIQNIIAFVLTIIGIISVVVFLWAAILYLTAGVNPGNISKANRAIIWAVIGIGIAVAGNALIAVIKAVLNVPPPSG